jgi:hypothetical protein
MIGGPMEKLFWVLVTIVGLYYVGFVDKPPQSNGSNDDKEV